MGATTPAKRGEARRAPAPPSHIQREVIGVILIALSLLTFLSLLSFVPGEAETVASGAPAAPPRNLIGSFGAVLAGGFFFLIGGAAFLFPLLLLLGARGALDLSADTIGVASHRARATPVALRTGPDTRSRSLRSGRCAPTITASRGPWGWKP